jgi:hypothetical protein
MMCGRSPIDANALSREHLLPGSRTNHANTANLLSADCWEGDLPHDVSQPAKG